MDVKRVFACAALLAGLLFFNGRLSAAVESDIVGYTTIETVPGFNMRGVAFQGLQGETVSLNELLSGDFKTGDEVQLFTTDGTNSGYTIYKYQEGSGWRQGRASADDYPVKAGDSFWLKTPDRSVSVTFKGAVKAGDFRYESQAGIQMVTADIPVEFPLNPTNGEAEWQNFQTGDQIQVLTKDGGYTIYTYSSANGKWLLGRVPTEATIPAGTSVWLKTASAGAMMHVINPVK